MVTKVDEGFDRDDAAVRMVELNAKFCLLLQQNWIYERRATEKVSLSGGVVSCLWGFSLCAFRAGLPLLRVGCVEHHRLAGKESINLACTVHNTVQ